MVAGCFIGWFMYCHYMYLDSDSTGSGCIRRVPGPLPIGNLDHGIWAHSRE